MNMYNLYSQGEKKGQCTSDMMRSQRVVNTTKMTCSERGGQSTGNSMELSAPQSKPTQVRKQVRQHPEPEIATDHFYPFWLSLRALSINTSLPLRLFSGIDL